VTQVIANGNTYSDDGTAAKDMQNGGHRTHLLPMLSDVLVDVADAATDAATASAAATSAQNYAAALNGTSSTSVTIGTGSKAFTTQASKQFTVGVWLLIYSTANPANYMYGVVTAYASTSLTVDVQAVGGSGTLADWKIAVAGIRGATGATGPNYAQARSAKVAGYTLVAGDQGNLIDCSGTFNLTFTAASTLGTSWWCEVKNSGTGIVTLVRSGSDTIDGLTTYTMMPGEHRRFFCRTSSTFDSVVLNPFRLFGTTSTTIPMPPGYTRLGFDLHGGGAGGQNGGRGAAASVTYGGGGGPGGGRHTGTIEAPAAGTTITLTKGDGGSGVAGRTTDGNPQSGGSGSASTIAWSSITRASAGGATAAAFGSTQYPGGIVTADLGSGAPGYIGGATGIGAYANGSTPGTTDGGSPPMGGAGGGGGGGRQAGVAYGYQGSAGGLRGNYPRGGGGAAGAAVGNTVAGSHGSTPTDGGGGGGSAATGNNAGNGAAGAGYGSGGGGGGAVDTGYTSGAGGAGTGGYFDIWGIV